MALTELPSDVFAQLLARLDDKDVCALSLVRILPVVVWLIWVRTKTCRRVKYNVNQHHAHWQEMIRGRFGEAFIPQNITQCRMAYGLRCCIRKYGENIEEVGGAWRDNTQHWTVQQDATSERGAVLHLQSVWWFDVGADFQVPNGVYQAYARVRAHNDSVDILEFRGDGSTAGDVVGTLSSLVEAEFGKWHLIQIPAPVIVSDPRGAGKVRLRLVEQTTRKYNFDIDYFELRPVARNLEQEARQSRNEAEEVIVHPDPVSSQ
ncbi:hypothetical protein RI367_006790 [Sorochytrium milnesiophthora]